MSLLRRFRKSQPSFTATARCSKGADAGIVLVPNPGATDSADHFLDALEARHAEADPGDALHHPAVMVGTRTVADTGCWAVTGYPGAGNMVLQGVLNEIDACRDTPTANRELDEVQTWTDHHARVIDRWVRRLIQGLGRDADEFVVSPGNLGQASVRVTLADGGALVLNHLPHAGFVGRNFGAHTLWTEEAARFFPRFGYRRVYLAVRDPLAVIASNAAKTVRPLEHALHDEAWFRGMARQMARYLKQADAQRDAFTLVRYEDLINEPATMIQGLGRDAGLELSEAQAGAIWDKVGFKPITPAGAEHLFNPKADKTRHYRRRHLAVLREEGLDEWFEPYGYALPDPATLPGDGMEPPDTVEKVPSALYGRIDPRSMHEVRDASLPLWIRSTDRALAEQTQRLIADTWLRRILGTLSDDFGKLTLPGG